MRKILEINQDELKNVLKNRRKFIDLLTSLDDPASVKTLNTFYGIKVLSEHEPFQTLSVHVDGEMVYKA